MWRPSRRSAQVILAAAAIVGLALALSSTAVVLPVLGHATWHLYRKAVVADQSPRADFLPRPAGKHHAAQFPVSLFKRTDE